MSDRIEKIAVVEKRLYSCSTNFSLQDFKDQDGWHNYSTDWSQGGPIIERERIDIRFDRTGRSTYPWVASNLERMLGGPTPLIAAMRSYVASKLGDEIEIPGEFISGEISPNKEN